MKAKLFICIICSVLLLGLSLPASAGITDPTGDNIGVVDLIGAGVEVYDRGDINLLKLSIEATPHLPAVVLFEVDVDDDSGTGGTLSTLGAPVPPCPCKNIAGMDIAVYIFTRTQGNSSTSAIAANCSDGFGPCGRQRHGGEWYAITSVGDYPTRAIGFLRGYLDPLPHSPADGLTEDCFTLPWSHIIEYAYDYLEKIAHPQIFDLDAAMADEYSKGKWQVSIWYDAVNYPIDEDDIADGFPLVSLFNINDWAPNVGTAGMTISFGADDITYCEGNFDGDRDVDGGDASKFKGNFGRSSFSNPCPHCGPNY